MPDNIRVRFAPSPTGFLHVGGLRTALFNFLFARKNDGRFILRVEDTDRAREVPGAADKLIEILHEFNLDFDEGPFYQSQRLDIYRRHAEELIKKNVAYKCDCSEERINRLKAAAEAAHQPFRYDKHCLHSPHDIDDKYVVRQNIPEGGITVFDDLVYGKIRVENRLLDDGVLVKSDGYPVYNFANVIDDHLMGITHVIRGEEFISSTPKHILLYQAFGWDIPQFAHLPLILNADRKKLSKRTDDVSVESYLQKGYLKETIINFIALLGWNPKTENEIFSLQDLIAEFDLKKINKSGAVFDVKKLDWLNGEYIKKMSEPDLISHITKYLSFGKPGRDIDKDYLLKILLLAQERMRKISDIDEFSYFFDEPDYDKNLLGWKNKSDKEVADALFAVKEILIGLDWNNFRPQDLRQKLDELSKKFNDRGVVYWPFRVALTGRKASPDPVDVLIVLGKEKTLKRIDVAMDKL